MSEFGFVNNNPGLQFEDHLTGLTEDTRRKLLELRQFVRSMGKTVKEEVRPHRIVYAKTMNFRVFLDVQPRGDGLMIIIKHGRSKPESAFLISSDEDLEAAKTQISQAFKEIK